MRPAACAKARLPAAARWRAQSSSYVPHGRHCPILNMPSWRIVPHRPGVDRAAPDIIAEHHALEQSRTSSPDQLSRAGDLVFGTTSPKAEALGSRNSRKTTKHPHHHTPPPQHQIQPPPTPTNTPTKTPHPNPPHKKNTTQKHLRGVVLFFVLGGGGGGGGGVWGGFWGGGGGGGGGGGRVRWGGRGGGWIARSGSMTPPDYHQIVWRTRRFLLEGRRDRPAVPLPL